MTQVPLAKNHEQQIDDARFLREAVASYISYFSDAFRETWPDAIDRYEEKGTAVNLIPGEMDAIEGAVVLVRNYEDSIDDGHYLNFAIDTFRDHLSGAFTDAWPEAFDALVQSQTPIDLVEGEVVESEHEPDWPEIGYDLPDPPKPQPTQLPADQQRPKPEQF